MENKEAYCDFRNKLLALIFINSHSAGAGARIGKILEEQDQKDGCLVNALYKETMKLHEATDLSDFTKATAKRIEWLKKAIDAHKDKGRSANQHVALFSLAFLWNELSQLHHTVRKCVMCPNIVPKHVARNLQYCDKCWTEQGGGYEKYRKYCEHRAWLLAEEKTDSDFYKILMSGNDETDLVLRIFKRIEVTLQKTAEERGISLQDENKTHKSIAALAEEMLSENIAALVRIITYHRNNVTHEMSEDPDKGDINREASRHIVFFAASLLWNDPKWSKLSGDS